MDPKVLIVDDAEVVRRGFAAALRAEQYDVETAGNADEAIKVMEARPFDVVLLDLRMPGMDGLGLLGVLKNRWPASEVVIVTGYPALETAREALRLGARDYLAKPLDPDALVGATRGAAECKRWALRKSPVNPAARPGVAA